jgi:plastocyanin
MRFYGLAFLASAAVLGACGGGGEKAADTTKAAPPAAAPGAAPAAAAPTSTVPKVAATGTTHEIKMIGDDKGYRFDPADITIKEGDAVKFIMVTGGPHNVAFDGETMPADAKAQLDANMDNKMADLSSPMLMNPNEGYTISFGGVKPGKYTFHCTPHLAMNMKGSITVQ